MKYEDMNAMISDIKNRYEDENYKIRDYYTSQVNYQEQKIRELQNELSAAVRYGRNALPRMYPFPMTDMENEADEFEDDILQSAEKAKQRKAKAVMKKRVETLKNLLEGV